VTTPRRCRCAGPPLSRPRRYYVHHLRPRPSTRWPPVPARSTATSFCHRPVPTTICRRRRRHRSSPRRHLASARSDLALNTSMRCPSSSTAAAETWWTTTKPSPPNHSAHPLCTASWTQSRLELSDDGLQALELEAPAVNRTHRCNANNNNNNNNNIFINLPPDVLHCSTLNTFKKHLKTHLFTSSLTSPD